MQKTLQQTRRVVIKLGTNILRSDNGELDTARIEKICEHIMLLRKRGLQVIIVSSGAVGLGMGRLGWTERPSDLAKLQMCAAVGQSALTETWENAFSAHDTHVAQVLLTGNDILQPSHRRIFQNFLEEVLDNGVIPIVNENDCVSTAGFRLGDNDSLSALIACRIRAELLIILSTIPGLMDKPEGGTLIPRVERVTLDIEALAGGSTTSTSVGGMITKIRAARFANAFGCGVFIGSGYDPAILSDIIEGTAQGTFFVPRDSSSKSRKRLSQKRWRAHFGEACGSIYVDEGAQEALLKRSRSLLAAGIKHTNGSFKKGALIEVIDTQERTIARGLSEFDSESLKAIAGKKSDEILTLFPRLKHTEVIHRDSMIILA